MKLLILVLLSSIASATHAAELVSAFTGSELLGEYEVDFDRFRYLSATENGIDKITIEGRLSSRVYRKPAEKSTLEVFRSYQKELKAGGFQILTSIGDNRRQAKQLGKEINKGDGSNGISGRAYQLNGKRTTSGNVRGLVNATEHYIAARKKEGNIEYLVVVLIADRRDLYAIDTVQTVAMEENTVVLSLDALRAQIASEGRVALYGILFDTGSAKMRAESQDALETIASYLLENPQRSFYVVGHTDDEGNRAGNMQLSGARADATVTALVQKVPNAKSRLTAHGVGPLSPVATNANVDGRQLNRRVELVSKQN